MNERLDKAYKSVDLWCRAKDIAYDIVCDEDDLQGYLIPKKYSSLTPRFAAFLNNLSVREGLHCRQTNTRSGTVFALSLQAISETTIEAMVPQIDRSRLARRLDLVFGVTGKSGEAVEEMQYNFPTRRHGFHRVTQNIGAKLTKRLQESLGIRPTISGVERVVQEALDGIASDYQPTDVLKQFERALSELGVLDSLKVANVTNRLSKDKQVIHFYVKDADGREREVAGYELVKLAEGNAMEQAIKDLIDLGRKRAPGTTEREAQAIKDREQKVRETAKAYSPEAQRRAAEQEAQAGPKPGSGAPPAVEGLASRLLSMVEG